MDRLEGITPAPTKRRTESATQGEDYARFIGASRQEAIAAIKRQL